MSIKETKVEIADIEPGMYVTRLDRPWTETPFLLQGFIVKTEDDINELKKYCKYVYVDVTLSEVVDEKRLQRHKASSGTSDFVEEKKLERHKTFSNSDEAKEYLTNVKPVKYIDKTTLDVELGTAKSRHEDLVVFAEDVMVDIAGNKKLTLPSLQQAINPMVDSITRNPDAFSWLTRMKRVDNYTYNHSVSTSIWAVAFGRHLGLPKPDLQSLAMGALLFDVGKMRLPEKLINNTKRYNQYEFKLVKQHVQHSVDIMRSIEGIRDDVVDMVQTHHERHNGSGYPYGLTGNTIPIFGRIAGIVDCYDAIISDRPYTGAISPHEAVKKLYEWRNSNFQAELVEQFIQVVGIYPVGTVVELSDGRVGVVFAQNRVWRLRPQIMLLLDQDKKMYSNFDIMDMMVEDKDINGNSLDIVRSVDPEKYGIDPAQFYL